jgi:murein L,D-transpeptidase YafK
MNSIIRRGVAAGLTVAACALIAGCDDSYLDQGPGRSQQPISSATLAEMDKLDTTPSSPTLIRAYKKEAELEIWKMKSDGQYALLKTYPMCRWSGQLGPKKREGDMQVPEGFYPIAPGQMNPNSHYYLSFNVGYPNAYDRAYDRTGGNVMVHGVCSSAGCFSMTDEQVADIYAIARESFAGGQREIQLQSYPFHMTAENLAKFRLDPNIAFWKELKKGSDHFEVAKTEPSVLVCGKHYVFDATANGEVSSTKPCPALTRDDNVEALVAEKEQKDDAKVADLVASGVKPIRLVYADGGQNAVFAGYKDESDPDALATGPQEIALSDSKPTPAAVKIAAADAAKRHPASVSPGQVEVSAAEPAAAAHPAATAAQTPPSPPAVALAAAPSQSSGGVLGGLNGGAQNVKKWLHLGGQEPPPPPVDASASDQAAPAAAPQPPRRDETASEGEKTVRMASLHTPPTPPARPNVADPASGDSNSSKTAPAAPPAAQ